MPLVFASRINLVSYLNLWKISFQPPRRSHYLIPALLTDKVPSEISNAIKKSDRCLGVHHSGDTFLFSTIATQKIARLHTVIVGDEGDDLHRAATVGTYKWIDFINFPDHSRPASVGNALQVFFDYRKG